MIDEVFSASTIIEPFRKIKEGVDADVAVDAQNAATWKTADSFPQAPTPIIFLGGRNKNGRATGKNSATQLSTKSDSKPTKPNCYPCPWTNLSPMSPAVQAVNEIKGGDEPLHPHQRARPRGASGRRSRLAWLASTSRSRSQWPSFPSAAGSRPFSGTYTFTVLRACPSILGRRSSPSGGPAPIPAPRRPSRREEAAMEEEIRIPGGNKKKYYN